MLNKENAIDKDKLRKHRRENVIALTRLPKTSAIARTIAELSKVKGK